MVVALAANAIIDETYFKTYLKLSGVAEDDLIKQIINGVSTLIENYCGSKFINQAVTEVHDGSGSNIQVVENCPIAGLTSIKYEFDTPTPVLQTITDFKFNGGAGLIKYMEGVFPEGWQNVQIIFSSGYGAAIANMPEDLRLATATQVEFFYKRDSADFSSTFEEGMIIKAPSEMLSPVVRDMLSPYFRNRVA